MTEQTQRHNRPGNISRRGFVSLAGSTGVGIVVPEWVAARQRDRSGSAKSTEPPHEEDVGPPEDLMREHGVLKRVLLIYDEGDPPHRCEAAAVAGPDQEQRADYPVVHRGLSREARGGLPLSAFRQGRNAHRFDQRAAHAAPGWAAAHGSDYAAGDGRLAEGCVVGVQAP